MSKTAFSGRANGYDIPRVTDKNWRHDLTCADCGCPITNDHVRCVSCSIRHRVEVQVVIPAEQYLQPTPDDMELIWYPRMAMSKRGRSRVRKLVRKRLEKYFARKQEQSAQADAEKDYIQNLIHTAWVKDFS